ncbi:probable inactive leucine-rich repeat receptor-like protein kinase At3g03770 [Ricinus communis]|uniref:Leucine-rich repeat protein, putative n=1 Tax=Ricinus communis TaxID=3988 RepID=B9SI80_RICCO|nr:probable inactive leucine-rich repeat receptor-like protein kinase At3g03770 [Ricinus communis]EEF36682.1 leucine-rich repeat protein, putative [Ricinus communis]|eukprot:XP_002525699.1 probable inactive leucine-rich repeat receptor-like protein kinase At3g03770 [Ricinus communis]
MAKSFQYSAILVFITVLVSVNHSEQLQSSQGETLLRIQRILNYPSILNSWNSTTDFCNTDPNPSLTVVCYEDSITQLHIIGNKGAPLLPRNFSIESFVTTLVSLPNLKVLTLVSLGLWGPLPGKIARLPSLEMLNMSSNFLYDAIPEDLSSLGSLQTLVLDDNMVSGELPNWLDSFPLLTVLSLKKNMFNGSLPNSLSNLANLRVLALSHNYFYGEVPDLSSLTNLQVLDLEDNAFGPQFPQLGNKLVTLTLSKNKFRDGIPAEVSSYYHLRQLDLSKNKFVGPFPPLLLSLLSITYINVADNKLTGMLFENQSCSADLEFVDLSSNLITGHLPKCLQSDSREKVLYAGNCLAIEKQNQNPISFCRNEALAVGILTQHKKTRHASKVITLGVIGGVAGGIAAVGLIFLIVRKVYARKAIKRPTTRLIAENASTGYPSKLLSDARYVSQTMKLGALGIPAYRTFSLEELEEATNNFDTSAFIGEGSQGQMYRGRLKNGSYVAIRCLKMKRSYSTQNFMHHIELISKLRHRHLISALGHCFECYLDDSSVSRIFLVFEYVPNGTLRSWISEKRSRQTLNWAQRIAAAIGVAKGIQFLHTGILPGVYSKNLKITDVLLDQNLVAKICSYNLPLLAENAGKIGHGVSSGGSTDPITVARKDEEEKVDVYDFGVILLEIIVGSPLNSMNEVDVLKDRLQASIISDEAARRSMVDPAVKRKCSDQSLKTMMEVCVRCLLKNPADRPSVEDVLWNLQFAAQVQDGWRGDSSEGSPISPSNPPDLHLTVQ